MTVTSSEEFRNVILKELKFQPVSSSSHHISYRNPLGEEYEFYQRPGCYEVGIADYTIPHNFHLYFANPNWMLRFGTVYTGTTRFRLQNQSVSSFSPSSFLVVEDHLKGHQVWKRGQHFHGIEITLYRDYLENIFGAMTQTSFNDALFQLNSTYRYLPLPMIQALQHLQALSDSDQLNAILLESQLLECVGCLYNELCIKKGESFSNQLSYDEIPVGNRTLRFNASDMQGVHKAHAILAEHLTDPPTIYSLSKMVLLNPQKLKAGFHYHYHMTIGEYVTSLRMSAAATLLCTTNLPIREIAGEVGYAYAANFTHMFKQFYGLTPLTYRHKH